MPLPRRLLWPLSIILLVVAALVALPSAEVAHGSAKQMGGALPTALDAQQELAQSLALADPRVQRLIEGQRSEVFGVGKFLDINSPINELGCDADNCRVVNIFNFDESATVQAFVRLDTQEVVEVYHQPGIRPGINRRLADRAMEIALNEPEVVDIIGEGRTSSDWAPMDSTLVGTACETGHMCVAPTFDMGSYILWAIIDLTDEVFVDTFWTATDTTEGGAIPYPEAYKSFGAESGGCPAPGTVSRNGWQLDYNTTNWDGFRVSNVRFNDTLVITSAKLVEWHADYGGSGYQDTTGCTSGGGGFTIYPFGDTEVRDLLDANSNVIGFEVVQDFRMNSWGSSCNYRYDQHFQFYTDGRFRTAEGAYGKGCGTNSLYRGLMRIDLAAGGTPENDNIASWNGTDWQPVTTETRWCPEGETHASCVGFTPGLNPDGYRFKVWDSQTNSGFYLKPDRGQYGPTGRGDFEFVYAVAHRASEGDNDLGVFGAGCCNDYNHGPEVYRNGESVVDQNLVMWYIPQMQTDASAPDYYCWTLTPPTTYPCYAGPMFYPIGGSGPAAPDAHFVADDPKPVGVPVTFDNHTSGPAPISYAWDFGDGATSTETSPTHAYAAPGEYTVTLTATNAGGSDSYIDTVTIAAAPDAHFVADDPKPAGIPVTFDNHSTGPAPMSYVWNFGDGAISTETSPTHAYAAPGTYTVTLTATNAGGSDSHTDTVTIIGAMYLPLITR